MGGLLSTGLLLAIWFPVAPEEAQLAEMKVVEVMFYSISILVFWTLGVFFAHRFNGRWTALVPFIAQLVPLVGFGSFMVRMQSFEGGDPEFDNYFIYLVGVILVLLVGVVSVVVEAIKSRAS